MTFFEKKRTPEYPVAIIKKIYSMIDGAVFVIAKMQKKKNNALIYTKPSEARQSYTLGIINVFGDYEIYF